MVSGEGIEPPENGWKMQRALAGVLDNLLLGSGTSFPEECRLIFRIHALDQDLIEPPARLPSDQPAPEPHPLP